MRARLMMKLMGIVVMLVLTVVAARSCSGSPGSSTLNPSSVLHNGVGGLCANEQATAAAAGSGAAPSLQLPAGDTDLANMAHSAGLSTADLSCPTTTVAGP